MLVLAIASSIVHQNLFTIAIHIHYSNETFDKSFKNVHGPCTLCKQQSFRYTLVKNIDSQERLLINQFHHATLSDTAYICQACMKQIKRNTHNIKTFHPRWLPKQVRTETICCIQNCKLPTYSTTNLLTPDELEEAVGVPVVAFTVDRCSTQLSLCQNHYNHMYRKITVSTPCDSCGMKPRRGESFMRHCPAPDLINEHLQMTKKHSQVRAVFAYHVINTLNPLLKKFNRQTHFMTASLLRVQFKKYLRNEHNLIIRDLIQPCQSIVNFQLVLLLKNWPTLSKMMKHSFCLPYTVNLPSQCALIL